MRSAIRIAATARFRPFQPLDCHSGIAESVLPRMSLSIQEWVAQIRSGDARALSRALTVVENSTPEAQPILRELFSATGHAWRIGVTGAPGSGKSTLTAALTAKYRAEQQTVGVIAVDPTSPFSGGAILGDRIRMQSHAMDEGVFIRSMATRGELGGLAQAAGDAALLLDASGKQVVLLETVGVGQDEVDVVRVADCTLVVLVPGMGDDVQSLKAGLMEIADVFVINKSDYPAADLLEQQLLAAMDVASDPQAKRAAIVRTVATEGNGIGELFEKIEALRSERAKGDDRAARESAYWQQWLSRLVQQRAVQSLTNSKGAADRLRAAASEVAARRKDPYTAVDELLGK
jgi:LAO/AO transport system kinase